MWPKMHITVGCFFLSTISISVIGVLHIQDIMYKSSIFHKYFNYFIHSVFGKYINKINFEH